MTSFDLFFGIDSSGAETPTSRLPGLQVYAARPGMPLPERWASPTRSNNRQRVNWARRGIAERLRDEVRGGTCLLAGIDHGFSFPVSYFDRYGLKGWPFDGWVPPPGKAVIVEVYPSIFRNRYPREGRSADEQDAHATARWMADMASRGAQAACFEPPLAPAERALASLEGWILGVR